MDGISYFQEQDRLRDELRKAIDTMRRDGYELSRKIAGYEVARADLEMRLRDRGLPATLIKDLVAGDEDVSMLKLERNNAQVDYDTDHELVMAIKKDIDVVRDVISREWGQAQYHQG